MSDICIKYKGQKLFINPRWIHEIMFLLVREFEREPEEIKGVKLNGIIEDYKHYYSIAGDVFENPTSFDEIFKDNPALHNLFLKTLKAINEKIFVDQNYLTVQDLEGTVDIGTRYLNDKIDLKKIGYKIEEVLMLLNQ